MKYLKMAVLTVAATVTLMATGSSVASATTLEIGGTSQNKAVTIWAVGSSGASMVMARTDGALINTCTEPGIHWQSTTFTGASVSGPVGTLAWFGCERPKTTHQAGSLSISHIAGTTNGTLTSSGAEWTVASPFGTLNCKTGTGVDLGTLKGVSSGKATIDINAVLNCGFLCPSVTLKGTLRVDVPEGLGVRS